MGANIKSNGSAVDAVFQPFVEFWSDYAKHTDDSARQLLQGFEEVANVRSWQQRWNDALSRSLDAYMRSPAFLRLMKQNTDAAIKVKRQTDDLATEVARNLNLPMASDISGLFERLHSVEESILDQLSRIEERLEFIETQKTHTPV